MLMGYGAGAWRRTALLAVAGTAGALLVVRGGALGSAAMWGGGCLLMTLMWGGSLREFGRRPPGPGDRAAVILTTIVLCALFVLSPGPRSADAYVLMGRGGMLSVQGADPYRSGPVRFPAAGADEPVASDREVRAHAPGLASTSALVTWIGNGKPAASLLVFRLLMMLIHFANGLLAAWIAGRWSAGIAGNGGRHVTPLRAALFILWNPLLLTQSIGEIHGGSLALFWMLLAVGLFQGRDPLMSAASAGMSASIGWIGAPGVALLAAQRRQSGGTRAGVVYALLAVGVVLIAFGPYQPGIPAASLPIPWRAASIPGGLASLAGEGASAIASAVGMAVTLPLRESFTVIAWGALAIWCFRLMRRRDPLQRRVESLSFFMLVCVLSASPSLRPGDAILPAGLAAVIACVAVRRAAAVASVALLCIDYPLIGAVRGIPLPPGPVPHLAAAVAVVVPITYILLRLRRRRDAGLDTSPVEGPNG